MNLLHYRRDAFNRSASSVMVHKEGLEALREAYRHASDPDKLILRGRIKRAEDELAPMLLERAERERELVALEWFARLVDRYPPPSNIQRAKDAAEGFRHWFTRAGLPTIKAFQSEKLEQS